MNSFNETNILITTNNTTSSHSLEFIPLGLLTLILSSFGVGANVLSAIVWLRPKMKSTYSTITLGLTFCDIIYLLIKCFSYGIQSMFVHFSVAREYTHIFHPLAGPTMRAIISTCHTGSTYLTIAVAADRYFVVCWPFRSRMFWSIKRSIFVTVGLMIFAILYNLPRWWEYESKMIYETNSTDYYYQMKATAFRRNKRFALPYKAVYMIVMNFIPFILLTFFNVEIWRSIRNARKRREYLTTVQGKQKSFAIMLISIVVLYLVCSSVYFVKHTVEIFGGKLSHEWIDIGRLLLTINSAANFILYCAFGSRFRREVVTLYKESFCHKFWTPKAYRRGTVATITSTTANTADNYKNSLTNS